MTKLLILIAFIVAHSCTPAFASICRQELSRFIELPKELKIKEDSLAFFVQKPEHLPLLYSLDRIFKALDTADLDELSRWIGEEPTDSDVADLRADQRFPPLSTEPAVEGRLANLLSSNLATQLEANDLVLLARLLKDVQLKAKPRVQFHAKANDQDDRRRLQRLKSMAGISRWRRALSTALTLPLARVSFQEFIQKTSYAEKWDVSDREMDRIATMISHRSPDAVSLNTIGLYLDLFVTETIRLTMEQENRTPTFQPLIEGDWLDRRWILQGLSDLLATSAGARRGINQLIDMMDIYLFGTAEPITGERLYRMALDRANQLLLPLKTEWSEFNASLKAHKPELKSYVFPTLAAKRSDPFEPRIQLHIRERSPRTPPPSELEVIEPESLEDLENRIPASLSLRSFTSYTRRSRPMSELRPYLTFQFWFLRDEYPTLQKIRFGKEAAHWLAVNEEPGRQMINALHMGRARPSQQGGIKPLARRSKRYDGQVYELKIKGNKRGLLLYLDDHWEFVTVVDKDEQERAIESIAPLPFL